MKAVVLTEPGSFEIAEVDDPTPARGEVVVEVAASGICGTDVHLLHGLYADAMPIIPGHEFSGRVVEVGADVRSLKVGDTVAADPNLPCMSCLQCQRGKVNLCENYLALGINRNGSAARYVAVPEAVCVRLPGPDLNAALIEPLSCAVHAYDVISDVSLGSRALLYGAGTMGLMMLKLARIAGLAEVGVVDLNTAKLAEAERLGAAGTATSAAELGDEPWDLVIDATGAPRAIVDGIARVRAGGTFLQFGISDPANRIEISPYEVFERELSIRGAVRPRFSFERAARLYDSGLIDPDIFVSDVMPLDDYGKALDMFVAGESRKILVTPND
jgi:2-desacetyl-2-hydroxyethyl bacteriochlorophyllide A dehydrogenase